MIPVMDEDEFWGIVAATRPAGASIADQSRELRRQLLGRSVAEVLAFHRTLRAVAGRADTRDMGHAAGLLLGGVGSDSFADVRTWLLCHGRATFERALSDPDTMADLSYDDDEEDFGYAEQFEYVANDVYAERTGGAPRDLDRLDEAEDPPDPEPYDQAALRARFPRLWARAESRHPEYLELRAAMYRHLRDNP
jgi:hypothetical protein